MKREPHRWRKLRVNAHAVITFREFASTEWKCAGCGNHRRAVVGGRYEYRRPGSGLPWSTLLPDCEPPVQISLPLTVHVVAQGADR